MCASKPSHNRAIPMRIRILCLITASEGHCETEARGRDSLGEQKHPVSFYNWVGSSVMDKGAALVGSGAFYGKPKIALI